MIFHQDVIIALDEARHATSRGAYAQARGYLRAADRLLVELEGDPPTTPGTPVAKRRSSDQLAAVRLPEPGLAQRVSDELEKGRGTKP